MRSFHHVACFALIFLSGDLSSAATQALELGPRTFPLRVAGVAVDIPVSASLVVQSEQGAPLVHVAVAGDLRSVQQNALQIARGLPLPRDNCARNGPNVVIDSIDSAAITPQGKTVVISLSGHVTAWACAKLLGRKVRTPAGSDVITLSIPVELEVPNKRQIRLKLSGAPSVSTGSGFGGNAARAFVGDMSARLSAELDKALDTAAARAMIPPLPGLDVTIDDARFAQRDSNVVIQASGTARISSIALNSMIELMRE